MTPHTHPANLDQELEWLKSANAAEQIPALEAVVELTSYAVQQAVNALEGPHPFLVAERLHRFGTVAIPPLEIMLRNTADPETRILAALVLLQLGSRLGVPCLLEGIHTSPNYACLSAKHLAQSGIAEAADVAIQRLRVCRLDEIDLILCLIDCLKTLNREIPADIRDRLTGADVPRLLRLGLSQFHQL